jgi:predicted MFS family arabinose efflux permease
MSQRSLASPWRNADLVKILIGEGVSDVGSQVGNLALPFAAALTLQASPAQMAALGAAEYLPPILVGLVGGAWIDGRRRRPVLIATNLARAMLLCIVAVAAATHVLRLEVLYAAGWALGALEVVFIMAFMAYLPSLVEPADLTVANSARATTSAAADVAGPALAGVLIQAFGTAGAVALDASSFLASVGGLVLVRAQEPLPGPRMRRPRIAHDVVEGWRFLLGQPILRAFTATAFSANFFYRVVMSAYVLYLTHDLALSPALVGVIFGLGGGVGVVLGSASAAAVSRRLGLGRSLVAAHTLFGAFGVPLALTVAVPQLGAPLVFASEFAQLSVNAVYMVNRTSVEQAITAPRLRGRVQGGRIVSHAVAGTAGLVVGGVLGEQFGTSAPILIGVLGGLTSFVWLLQSPIPDLAQIPRTGDAPSVNDAR